MDTHVDQRRENYYYEALGFSWHNIDLEFDEEHMKAERTWYQEPTRECDDS